MTNQTEHATSSDTSAAKDADAFLVEFIHERDHPCPRCGYNLRNLQHPTCPECQESLLLKVGVQQIKLYCLILTLAPMYFCFIVGGIFLLMAMRLGFPSGSMPPEAVVITSFIALSGIGAMALSFNYHAFLKLSDAAQVTWMITTWIIHFAVFAYFVNTL